MDIFSLGCVIAEIFLDGHLFTLPELLAYRKTDIVPQKLGDIKDEAIRNIIVSMISLKPENRNSIDYYINYWQEKVIPDEMKIIHVDMVNLTLEKNASSPWKRIEAAYEKYKNFKLLIKDQNITIKNKDVFLSTGRRFYA